MQKRLIAGLAAGTLAMFGLAAGPGDSEGNPPEEAEQACRGIQEAQGDEGGNGQTDGTPAEEILSEVADLLDSQDNDCDDHGAASGDRGRPGDEG